MNRLGKIFVAFALALILFSGETTAQMFGSKVMPGDSDIGLPLDAFAPPQTPVSLVWVDTGPNPLMYDEGDVVYLHIGPVTPPVININDIRLTSFGPNEAGSKVTTGDNDWGKAGLLFPPLAGIYFSDLFGTTTGYDLNDPVYVNVVFPWGFIDTNDVRLTAFSTANSLLQDGVKVKDFDEDHGKPLSAALWPTGGGALRFYNANGNFFPAGTVPIYDYPDDVYLDMPGGGAGVVSVNDIRLTRSTF